jgi:hypothetical protein
VATIFEKIDRAAVFVPDLTFVGARSDGRPTPNPNVLIEYGWALKAHGYHHIVPVMNTAYGEPDDANMPFNLKHLRRPITYCCEEGASDPERKVARDGLARSLASAIRAVINSDLFLRRSHRDAPFLERQPIDGAGRFRRSGEALGLLDWHDSDKPVLLCDWPLAWFRMLPLRAAREEFLVSRLKQEIRLVNGTSKLSSFQNVFGPSMYVRGPDGYGSWDPAATSSGDSVTASGAAYVFSNGELWSVDGSRLRNSKSKNYIPLEETTWLRLLVEQAQFLYGLGLGATYRWIAGMEDLRGRGIFVQSNPYRPSGSCTLDKIEVSGSFTIGGSAAAALEPFFAKIYDACGVFRGG